MTEQIERIIGAMEGRNNHKTPFLIAIDGGSAGGKTTLGFALRDRLGATLVHMDDFFLPPELRTPQRLAQPGGNVHYERVLDEVLQPLRRGEDLRYGVFDCAQMAVGEIRTEHPAPVVIVEGAYSLHPALRDYYDLKVFLPSRPEVQRARILQRNGPEKLQMFLNKWIPLEQAYFDACGVEGCCDLVLTGRKEG